LYGANAVASYYGTYQDLDYVAMFPEGANTKQAAGTTMNVGWSPVVTGVLTLQDGGKAMCGFGKVAGNVMKGWLVKMWSGSGSHPCNS
jgi:hypothetical protein